MGDRPTADSLSVSDASVFLNVLVNITHGDSLNLVIMQKAAGLRHTDRLMHPVCDAAAWLVHGGPTFSCLVHDTRQDSRDVVGVRVSVGQQQRLQDVSTWGKRPPWVDEVHHLVKCGCSCRPSRNTDSV